MPYTGHSREGVRRRPARALGWRDAFQSRCAKCPATGRSSPWSCSPAACRFLSARAFQANHAGIRPRPRHGESRLRLQRAARPPMPLARWSAVFCSRTRLATAARADCDDQCDPLVRGHHLALRCRTNYYLSLALLFAAGILNLAFSSMASNYRAVAIAAAAPRPTDRPVLPWRAWGSKLSAA